MILVGQYDSPYVRRVAVSMHLMGLPFARNTLSGFADAEAMRRINPLGRIPSLILEDGEVLIDSTAILDHLEEAAPPDARLLPAAGGERRNALRIIALATGCIDKAGAIVYERGLRPVEKVHLPWIERCRVQLDSGLSALDELTGPGWYLGTGRIMQPDVTVGCMIGYLEHRFPEALRSARLKAFLERVAGIEAFRRTAPAPDEAMPAAPL